MKKIDDRETINGGGNTGIGGVVRKVKDNKMLVVVLVVIVIALGAYATQ